MWRKRFNFETDPHQSERIFLCFAAAFVHLISFILQNIVLIRWMMLKINHYQQPTAARALIMCKKTRMRALYWWVAGMFGLFWAWNEKDIDPSSFVSTQNCLDVLTAYNWQYILKILSSYIWVGSPCGLFNSNPKIQLSQITIDSSTSSKNVKLYHHSSLFDCFAAIETLKIRLKVIPFIR